MTTQRMLPFLHALFLGVCAYTLSDVIVVLTLTVYSEKQTSANSTFQMRGNDRMCNLSTTTTSKVNAAKKKKVFK